MQKESMTVEADGVKASILNVNQSVLKIKTALKNIEGLQVTGVLYNTESGAVDFGLTL